VYKNFLIFLRKVFKRLYYIFYNNPKKNFFRKLSFHSLNNNPSFLRISSSPYVSGDTFRNYSDHVFDETRSINPKKVKNGDTVFLKTELKEIFFSEFHRKISARYILISHNSDISIERNDLNYIDENLIHWFAMKLNVKMNNKISPLPSGLENYRYLNNGIIKNFENAYNRNLNKPKTSNVLCSFNVSTNKAERVPLVEVAKSNKIIHIKKFNNNMDYLNNLSNYRYNLCPEGNNYESHRLWETLFFENIPIVKNNLVNLNFVNLGIPMVMVEDWKELNSESIKDTLKTNIYNSKSEPRSFVLFEFWKNKIELKKKFT